MLCANIYFQQRCCDAQLMYAVCVSLYQRYLRCDTHSAVRAGKVAHVLSCQTRHHKQQQQIGLHGSWRNQSKQTKVAFGISPVIYSLSSIVLCLIFWFLCPYSDHLLYNTLLVLIKPVSIVYFSIGQIFTSHGTQRATPGFRTFASPRIWYGSQISCSTTGRFTSFHLLFFSLLNYIITYFTSHFSCTVLAPLRWLL